MNFKNVGPLADDVAMRERIAVLAKSGQTIGSFTEHGEFKIYFKGSPLSGRALLRHTLRSKLLGIEFPRLAEFENLNWLRDHGFRAPRPLAAGIVRGPNQSPYQFLVTEEVLQATTLDRAVTKTDEEHRLAIVTQLGRDVARLHNSGFVHRDLYPRNLLLTSDESDAEPDAVTFIDYWRGGTRKQSRGADYDQACLMVHGSGWFKPAEQAAYFRAYREVSEARSALEDASAWFERIDKERTPLAKRFNRQRTPKSPLPPADDWKFAAVLAEL